MGVQVHVDHVLRAYQGLFSNEARGFFFFSFLGTKDLLKAQPQQQKRSNAL
jgi:hypothetical protein